ncbi:MAG: S9 family peptidase [Sandaracinus sp.]|nr:S9 family peptidase [Sandaracinus sp.]MCB9622568.1 S9 family peptidase [Sandaracinus sp.]
MRHLALLLLFALACGGTQTTTTETTPTVEGPTREASRPRPPLAKQVPHELRAHDQVRQDPYYWMRDDDRNDPEVLAHLAAENEYTEAMLEPLAGFRESLYQEIVARIPQDDVSVPARYGEFLYYQRVEAGKEYPIHCRRPVPTCSQEPCTDADEEVLLDANELASEHSYYDLRGLTPTHDGKLLAYAEDTLSRRIYTIRVKNLEDGSTLTDTLEGTSGNSVWSADGRTLFYVKRDPQTLRAHQVWRHALGTPSTEDVLVFDETDDEFYVSIFESKSRDFVMIGSYQTLAHEYRYVDARNPTSEPKLVLAREEGHEYDVDHALGRFYIRTNWEARDFRLMSVAPVNSGERDAWRVEVPAQDGVFFEGFELFSGHLVVNERRDGILRLRVIPWKVGERPRARGRTALPNAADLEHAHEIAMDEDAYWTGFGDNDELASGILRFEYASMTTPPSVFDYDLNRRTRTLRKQEEVVGGFDREQYVSHRLNVPARDGTLVPVSIVHRRDLDRASPQPLLLYGYGSYGYSLDPTFSSSRLSLLNRGVIFAIAHVRGGQERGRAWYEDGKLLHKMNTFTDFIDVGRHLVQEGWTTSEKLFAHGGSAGGLLMGAVANMAPDLFGAIVADVPFVDVVTTMLDETIPLTTFEYDEWGNPNEREYYDYMMQYSPYDNVAAQAYPPMLVLTGLHDSQVQYWEPMKWVARLRERKTDDNLLLFDVNMEAGHGGASGRFRRHKETALVYAFLLDRVGVRR